MQHQIRIAVDARALRWSEGTGVARYRANLARAAARIGAVEPIGDGVERAAWRGVFGRARAVRDADGWRADDVYRLARRHFSLTGRLLTLEVDGAPGIAHWSYPMPLVLAGAANVVTVHDLIPLETPDLTGMPAKRHDRLLRALIAAGVQLVTVSEVVRSALIARYALADERVTCCFQPVETGAPGVLPAGLAPGYFLALGRVEARKNIERLVIAHRESGTARPLVLAGPDGHWADPAERRRVAALIAGPNVIRLGWQSDDTTAALLANAHALLMPSLAEGFGLPAIEAMAAGVPALVGDRGAATEIAGNAALQADPFDTAAIADAIRRLDHDEPLRADLVRKGRVRATEFSMETFAARLSAVYDRLELGKSGPA